MSESKIEKVFESEETKTAKISEIAENVNVFVPTQTIYNFKQTNTEFTPTSHVPTQTLDK